MSVNPPNMQPQIQMDAQLPLKGPDVKTQAAERVNANGRNIIEAIDSVLKNVGPDDTVEIHGMVERENPNNLESPLKITTYKNQEFGPCYKIPLVWEIKITKADGTEKRVEVRQNRCSTLQVPPVNKLLLETDRAYKASILGNEYAKTISAIYDTNNPEHAEMQNRHDQLLENDALFITIKPNWFYNLAFAMGSVADPYDPDVLFKGFGSSTVQLFGEDGKKVTIINRNFRKEVHEVDNVSQRVLRTMKKQPTQGNFLLNGLDVLIREKIKLDRQSEWFKKLTEIEGINKDNLVQELEDNGIPKRDWAERVSKRAPKVFEEGLRSFGGGTAKLQQIVDYYKDPNNKREVGQAQEDYDDLPKHIAQIRNFADQLEHLESMGIKIHTDKHTQWSVSTMRDKVTYMEQLHHDLKDVFGKDPNIQVIPV